MILIGRSKNHDETMSITIPAFAGNSIKYASARGEIGKHIGFKLRRFGLRVQVPPGTLDLYKSHALVMEWHTYCAKNAGFKSSNLFGCTISPNDGIGIHA